MNRIWLGILLLLATITVSVAAENRVEAPTDCKLCGMNRTQFSHSRMLVTYGDGSTGTCSINCTAIELMENKGRTVKSLQVGDYNTRALIDAKTATWVIGGKKRGVMTDVAKWAFADRKAAERFVGENGGRLTTFAEAIAAAEKEQASEESHHGHGGHGK
jgi:nitrous oxide reductase accessory protein NosL